MNTDTQTDIATLHAEIARLESLIVQQQLRRHFRLPRHAFKAVVLCAGLTTLLLTGTLVSAAVPATIPNANGVFNVCYITKTGKSVRLVDITNPKQVCKRSETATTWSQMGPTGAKGDKGDIGATGAAGVKGDKGDTGATGAAGAKGDKGDTGATGAAGLQGATGAQGAKGDKGDTGAQGAKGDKGDTGLQGAKGDAGAKGDTGAQGVKGDTGAAGAKGDTGATGATGAQGATGAAGVDAPKRISGYIDDVKHVIQITSPCTTLNQGGGSYQISCPVGTFKNISIPFVATFAGAVPIASWSASGSGDIIVNITGQTGKTFWFHIDGI